MLPHSTYCTRLSVILQGGSVTTTALTIRQVNSNRRSENQHIQWCRSATDHYMQWHIGWRFCFEIPAIRLLAKFPGIWYNSIQYDEIHFII